MFVSMLSVESHALEQVARTLVADVRLSPGEYAELLRIAKGFQHKESACLADLSVETIRTFRKRLYRKLRVHGAHEILAALLQLALQRDAADPRESGASYRPGPPDRSARLVSGISR